MSFFARIWSRIRSPTGFVGKDLEGNLFYEYTNKLPGGRTKRVVKYRDVKEVCDSAAHLRTLPAQWTAWLSHTRSHPPTVVELQADMARMRRVVYNAAVLEAKEKEQRAQLLAAQNEKALSEPNLESVAQETRAEWVDSSRSEEPEPWSPKVIRRG